MLTAVITGAASGIGEAIALKLAGRRANIVIANAVAFLVSDEASYIIGAALDVNGGALMM